MDLGAVHLCLLNFLGFPGASGSKESACSAGDLGLIPGSGGSPGEGNDNTLQYSCLENPMDRGDLVGYSPWGCVGLDPTKRLTLLLFGLSILSLMQVAYQVLDRLGVSVFLGNL